MKYVTFDASHPVVLYILLSGTFNYRQNTTMCIINQKVYISLTF